MEEEQLRKKDSYLRKKYFITQMIFFHLFFGNLVKHLNPMKIISYVDLHEQIVEGESGKFSCTEEAGVVDSVFQFKKEDLSVWQRGIKLPGVIITHFKLNSPAPVAICTSEKIPSSVNMSFMVQGNLDSSFEDLQGKIHNRPMRHNLLYLSNPVGQHIFTPEKGMQNFHFAFDIEYFKRITGEDTTPVDSLRNQIEQKRTSLFSHQHGWIDRNIYETLEDIRSCLMKGSTKKLYLEAKVLELLALQLQSLQEAVKEEPVKPSEQELFHKIKKFLEDNYLEPITLNSISRSFGINEFKLKKGFQQYFKTSVIKYMSELRMSRAREILMTGDMAVSEVSEMLNYSHPNHFSNAFRKHFGIPPSEVRKVRSFY